MILTLFSMYFNLDTYGLILFMFVSILIVFAVIIFILSLTIFYYDLFLRYEKPII